jgi:hypothetical protein
MGDKLGPREVQYFTTQFQSSTCAAALGQPHGGRPIQPFGVFTRMDVGVAVVKSSLQCCCEFVKLPRACDPLILTLVKMPAKMGCEMSESKFLKSGAVMDGIFVAPEVNQPRVY